MAETQEPEDPTQDPHFVPEDSPDFIPYPKDDVVALDASGPTDRNAPPQPDWVEDDDADA